MYKLLMMPWNSTIVCNLYFHLFLSNLGPNKTHMSSWDTSMFVMFLKSLPIPWTSIKQCRSSSSSKPSDCPCSLRKTRIVKCQNKRNIGKKKCENQKIVFFWYLPLPYYRKVYQNDWASSVTKLQAHGCTLCKLNESHEFKHKEDNFGRKKKIVMLSFPSFMLHTREEKHVLQNNNFNASLNLKNKLHLV